MRTFQISGISTYLAYSLFALHLTPCNDNFQNLTSVKSAKEESLKKLSSPSVESDQCQNLINVQERSKILDKMHLETYSGFSTDSLHHK